MIKTENLTFGFENDTEENLILKGIDLEVKNGEFLCILGHNGSGKSTLAKHFNAIYLPSGGRVLVDGIDTKCDFEFTAVKSFGSDLVIDNDFLEGIENNTLIAATGNLTFNKNTDKELLKEKMVFFVSTGNIIAPEKIMSLLKLKSQTTGKFKTNG